MLEVVKLKLFAVLSDRRGISALEYAILAGAIIGVVATAMVTVGSDVNTIFNKLMNAMNTAAS